MSDESGDLVLCFVPDLYFAVRIENAVYSQGGRMIALENPAQVVSYVLIGQPSDLSKPDGETIPLTQAYQKLLVALHPALVIFQLGATDFPWESWIKAGKDMQKTAGIPIVAFGSHLDTDTLQFAKEAGADHVLAKSRFLQVLPQLVGDYLSGRVRS